KHLVLFNRTAETAAKLILAVCRRLRRGFSRFDDRVEKVARLKLVVAEKLVRRAMKCVRSRAARRIDYRARATELRGVSVGQRLKFRNRLDAECGSEAASAGSVVPEIDHVLVIQQVGLSRRPRSGDRILLSISVKRAAGARSALRDL